MIVQKLVKAVEWDYLTLRKFINAQDSWDFFTHSVSWYIADKFIYFRKLKLYCHIISKSCLLSLFYHVIPCSWIYSPISMKIPFLSRFWIGLEIFEVLFPSKLPLCAFLASRISVQLQMHSLQLFCHTKVAKFVEFISYYLQISSGIPSTSSWLEKLYLCFSAVAMKLGELNKRLGHIFLRLPSIAFTKSPRFSSSPLVYKLRRSASLSSLQDPFCGFLLNEIIMCIGPYLMDFLSLPWSNGLKIKCPQFLYKIGAK